MSIPIQTALPESQIQLIMRALADPRRYDILKKLGDCDNTTPCVAIRGSMRISAATLSHHMRELEIAGLVDVVRDGKFASYRLRRDVLEAFLDRIRTDLT